MAKIKPALVFAVSFVPVHLGAMLYLNSDKYMLEKFMSMEVVGIYTALSLITTAIIVTLMGPIFDSFYPVILKEKDNPAYESAHKVLMIAMQLMALALVFTLSLLPKEATFIILGSKYLPHTLLIFGFLPIAFCQFLSQLLSYNFHLTNKIWLLAIFELSLASINILLNLYLIPLFGLKGAIFASILTMGGKLILITLVGRKLLAHFSIPIRQLALTLLTVILLSGIHYLCFDGGLVYRLIILVCEYILLAIVFYQFLNHHAPDKLNLYRQKLRTFLKS